MIKVKNLLAMAVFVLPALAMAGPVDNDGLDIPKPEMTSDASITEYTDEPSWLAAVGGPTVINAYGELADGVVVTNQYLPLGATYTDGDDTTFLYNDSLDGMLLNGNGRIHVDFMEPLYAVAMNYPGAVRITGYLGGQPVFTSSDLGGSGNFLFAGIVSTDAFDSVEIMDWVDDAVYIDDLNYNESTVATEAAAWGQIKALFH